jgi:HSP20 family protein
LFDEPFFRPSGWFVREFELPAVDVKTTADAIQVEAALPGIKPEEVEVTVDGDILTIKGTWKTEDRQEDAGYVHRELSRVITLPSPVRASESTAAFKDGMLTLTLPKAASAKPARIAITPA